MRRTWNPSRRNKNIGTPWSGYGDNNKFVIPQKSNDPRAFWENLINYKSYVREIREQKIKFLVEPTKTNYKYCCTIEDIAYLLSFIPEDDISFLDLIIFRQPKKKEAILRPVWGRLAFNVSIGNFYGPAIIIEAVNIEKPIYWSNSLDTNSSIELERLKADGHKISHGKRKITIESSYDSARSTQLYRTLFHEIGHWVQWQNTVLIPDKSSSHDYFRIPESEREVFAHRYADKLRENLLKKSIIPFERKYFDDISPDIQAYFI